MWLDLEYGILLNTHKISWQKSSLCLVTVFGEIIKKYLNKYKNNEKILFNSVMKPCLLMTKVIKKENILVRNKQTPGYIPIFNVKVSCN